MDYLGRYCKACDLVYLEWGSSERCDLCDSKLRPATEADYQPGKGGKKGQ